MKNSIVWPGFSAKKVGRHNPNVFVLVVYVVIALVLVSIFLAAILKYM